VDGRPVTTELVRSWINEELGRIHDEVGAERFRDGRFVPASQIFGQLVTSRNFVEFLTLVAYDHLDG
jgi:malate synthase